MPTSTTRPGPIAWATAVVLTLYMLTPIPTWPLNAWPTLGLMLVLPALVGLVLLHHLAGRPVLLCGLLALLWCVSPAVLGPALVAQQLVAVTKRHRSSALTATVLLAGKAVWAGYALLDLQSRDSALLFETILSVGGIVVATLVGLLRRAEAESQARTQEAESARRDAADARVNEARLAERERIAREMHDVVAHRISLIALHAGGLAHRMANPEEAELARLIQTNAQAALTELRGVLRGLRGPEAPPEPPQPTLADLDQLVADARAAGQKVDVQVTGDLGGLGAIASRHAYRIVQEGLTNARKHAPGAPVALTVDAVAGLRLVVSNPLADLAAPDRTGAGLGLVGVVERVEQLDGEVTHGVHGSRYVLEVALPEGAA